MTTDDETQDGDEALEENSNVVAFPGQAESQRRFSGAHWAFLAIGAAAALILGRLLAPATGPFVLRNDGLYAGPQLERVLTTQLASRQNPNAATRIGATFRARDGAFCRTFVYETALSGLACREAGAWRLRMLAPSERLPGAERRAPREAQAVLNAASAIIEDDPFDAAGEAEARRVGWR